MPQPKILVIDDQLLNIRLLERKLVMDNMEVLSSTNGPDGIQMARETLPDVILLDIVMPGMDGIEVCRQLKADAELKEIPVIFITARNGKEDKLEGFDVGAADFLVKPIELDEALARIRTQLRIIEEHDANLRLTRQLEQSRRQSSIMHLTEGIAHNLNNLLGVTVGYTSLMKRNSDKPDKVLSNCDRMEAAIKRMTRIVQQLTVIGQFKSLKKEKVDFSKIVTGATGRFQRSSATSHSIQHDFSLPESFAFATNRELLEVCLERLFQNAHDSYQSEDLDEPDTSGEIVLTARIGNKSGEKCLILKVQDRGKGIDPDIKDSIFEPFVTSSSVIGRGMGLTFARHSVKCMGGLLTVHDREGGGIEAVVTLPLNPETELED
ncbi:MAG: response regulator [Puniceicoccaceae bacterium]